LEKAAAGDGDLEKVPIAVPFQARTTSGYTEKALYLQGFFSQALRSQDSEEMPLPLVILLTPEF